MAAQIIKTRNDRKISDEEMKRMRAQDHKMVKGIFRCFEPTGGSVTFSFKKYRGDQVHTYTLVDGSVYEVPLMVAKHLNQDCAYPVHRYTVDKDGIPRIDVGKRERRMSFESLEFQDLTEVA